MEETQETWRLNAVHVLLRGGHVAPVPTVLTELGRCSLLRREQGMVAMESLAPGVQLQDTPERPVWFWSLFCVSKVISKRTVRT